LDASVFRGTANAPDGSFSLEGQEFGGITSNLRTAERALAAVRHEPNEHGATDRAFRRSPFAVEDMQAGDVIAGRDVRSIRPGCGLAPEYLSEVMGRRAAVGIARDTLLTSLEVAP
jgi:sialic acid synthase SpsE